MDDEAAAVFTDGSRRADRRISGDGRILQSRIADHVDRMRRSLVVGRYRALNGITDQRVHLVGSEIDQGPEWDRELGGRRLRGRWLRVDRPRQRLATRGRQRELRPPASGRLAEQNSFRLAAGRKNSAVLEILVTEPRRSVAH